MNQKTHEEGAESFLIQKGAEPLLSDTPIGDGFLHVDGSADDSRASRIFVAEPVSNDATRRPTAARWFFKAWSGLCFVVHWLFGLLSLVIVLSVLATIPLLQFLSLGYFLEATGRIARSGRIRDGFIGIDKFARIGSVALGTFVVMLPVRLFSSLWYSSYLLNGNIARTQFLRLTALSLGIAAFVHISWAVCRGGKLRHFCWPAPLKLLRLLRVGGLYDQASHALLDFVTGLRLRHYCWLGLRGFAGAFLWLVLPITMMAVATKAEDPGFGGLVAVLGGILLATVLVYLPFLQSRLAVTGRFRGQFDVRAVRRQFRKAPIAFWFSLLMTLTLAIPLYLLKAELIPREAAWLPSLFFVTFMFPARIVVGWAISRAERRAEPRIWISRWLAWIGLWPVTLMYALIVYFTQFTSWHGSLSLYEQHAFLVPVPFLGY